MEIIIKGLDEIWPYENNPRVNDGAVGAVAESIREFGFQQPIVVDRDGVIIAGHTRYKAAQKLGLTEVPVVVAGNLTDEQVRAYRLADNKTGELAEWDFSALEEELAGIGELDMSLFGFEPKEMKEPEEITEDDYEEEPPEVPKARVGDIYQLGRHRLMCGDSTDVQAVQKLCQGQVDLLLTDPPYGVDYTGKTKDALKIQNDAKTDEALRDMLADAFSAANVVMKPGAVFYIWHADSKSLVFRLACQMAGWEVRQVLIWAKNTMVMGRQDYQWKHEPCLYGWKEGAGHLWASDRKQTTLLEFDRPTKNKEHPTMKPVKLFDYQIQNNTKGGDIVLDLFGGSGTTIIACEQDGRCARVMELDPRYVDVIIDRWEKLTGERAVKIDGAE
nr:MAG TPA: adenine specific DNA methyltransferase [Caudoviricetes sp.]